MIIPKDVYEYVMDFADLRTILNMLSVNKYFRDPKFFQKVIERLFPLLIPFKREDQSWKIFLIDMSYYVGLLQEKPFEIPYIPVEGYNPKKNYQKYIENKDEKYLYNVAMIFAALGGYTKVVKSMIEKGATNFNDTMAYAAEGGYTKVVKLMIEKGATDFDSAMINAAYRGDMDIVKLMIEKGATNFNFAIANAAYRGDMDIVKLMIEKGATAFNWATERAAFEGHTEIVNYLKQFIT